MFKKTKITGINQRMEKATVYLEAIFTASLDAMIVTNATGVIEMFNPAAERMFGYLSEEVIGLNVSLLMPLPDSTHHPLYMARYVETRQSRIPRQGREVIAKRRNGETFFADITLSDVRLNEDIIFTAVIRDITARKNEAEKMIQLAFFDQETGLPNGYYLRNKINDLLTNGSETTHYLISLYVGDLTDYINIFGVQGIKDVIVGLVALLRSQLPAQSLLARCGTRHLKIIYPAKNPNESAEDIAEQLLRDLNQPLQIAGNHIFLNVTLGLTPIISPPQTVKSLLDQADIALYMAKRHIAKRYEVFQTHFAQALHRHALIVQKLYQAIDAPPFQLYLQPQISLINQQIIGVEALIRWQEPTGEWLSPAEFIPIAETIGLIKDITLWTLRTACLIVKDWHTRGNQAYRIAINISPQVLCHARFVQELKELMTEMHIAPQALEFEITETALMSNIELAISVVKELAALGISISIDDFGTGLSSLAYLKLFPIDRLKIDRSFIVDALSNAHDRAMLKAIINLGHELNYQVVCEGVETQAQLLLLKRLGCDEIQGYYFAKPMPYQDFPHFAAHFDAAHPIEKRHV